MAAWRSHLATVSSAAGAIVARRDLPTLGAVVLGYHDVHDPTDGGTPEPTYSVPVDQLRRQVRWLREWGLHIVDLGELLDRLAADDPVDGLVAVTFDDALAGVHRHALPVLADEGVPATMFAVVDRLGLPADWWPASGPLMPAAALRELADAGWRIGSHTATHPSLPTLGPDALAAELAGSRAALADLVGQPVDVLAYPQGHHDRGVRAAATSAGYRAAVTFLNGRVTPGLDPLRLPRLTMGPHHGALRLAHHLARPPAAWPDTQLDRVVGEHAASA